MNQSWTPALLMLGGAAFFGSVAAYVWHRRRSSGATSLTLILLAGVEYTVTYALELNAIGPTAKATWGDLKYLGVCLLPPAWLAFTLEFTGLGHRLTRRLLALLSVEPIVVLSLLANGATRDLVRVYPPSAVHERLPVVGFGPVGWVNVFYSYGLVLAATGPFVVKLARLSSLYRRQSWAVLLSLAISWVLNILYNFNIGPFGRFDLTPLGFAITSVVLVWGLFRFRLLNIAPIARSRVIETIGDGILVLDAYDRIVQINPAAEECLGCSGPEVLGQRIHGLLPDHAHALLAQGLDSDRREGELTLERQGARRSYELSMSTLRDAAGRPTGRLLMLRESTERKRAEDALRESEARFHSAFDEAPIGMLLLGSSRISDRPLKVNQALCRLLSYREQDILSRSVDVLLHPSERANVQDVLTKLAAGELSTAKLETGLVASDGRIVWTLISSSVVSEDADTLMLVVHVEDITARKQAEERLVHEAFHDSLTGLANRTLFKERLEHALAGRLQADRSVAVLFCDVDNFKGINDSLGHSSADLVLVEMARRLRTSVRPSDTVARLGGDEFAVLLEGVTNELDPIIVAERITQSLRSPIEVDDRELYVTTSIGIALGGDAGDTADSLLRNADLAMYRVKARGLGGYERFKPAMRSLAVDRLELEAELHHGLRRQELTVHYQPIVELRGGEVVGVEALVRWRHPTLGLVAPAKFIPVAERSALITEIGGWVLREACQQMTAWHDRWPDRLGFVAVNLSARQVRHPGILADVQAALVSSGLAPEKLILEITESTFVDQSEEGLSTLQLLKADGVRLAIDDFGAGYSSLSYLHRLPVDVLKIDRSFIEVLAWEPDHGGLVASIVHIGQALNLKTIAEGVETREQLVMLRTLGCELGQGFSLSVPLPADDLRRLLERTNYRLPARG